MVLAFLAAALSTPFGTLVSWPVVSQIETPDLSALLSLSAGALVYVGATHLLPQTERDHDADHQGDQAEPAGFAVGIIAGKGYRPLRRWKRRSPP